MLPLTMGLLAWPLLQPLRIIKRKFLPLSNPVIAASASVYGGLVYWKTTPDSESKLRNALLSWLQLGVGIGMGYLLIIPFEIIQILKKRVGAIPAALNRQRGTYASFGG
jgi:hypothetical protein